jgi:arylsulfatase A-like enzyme
MRPNAPNILFITCDQLRKDALGCYGNPVIRTPNIDRLATQSIQLGDMHVACPVCAPNRASWATGRMPSAHGLKANGTALPQSELTFMETLRRNGYHTGAAGKLHFRPQWNYRPGDKAGVLKAASGEGAADPQPPLWELPFYGLESCMLVEDHNAGPYGEMLRAHGFDPWEDPHSFTYPQHITQRSRYPAHLSKTTWITDRSLEFLERQDAARPFFLWTSYVHPHHPFVVPAPFDTLYNPADMPLPQWLPGMDADFPERYRLKYLAEGASHEAIGMHKLRDEDWQRIKATYYGMISHIDEEVGRLLDWLEEHDQLDRTLIIFSSDHGELLGDYHLLFKATHHGCVTSVPCLWKLPGASAGNRRLDGLCSCTDLMPTLLDLAGADIPEGVQGRSLRPLFENDNTPTREELLIEDQTHLRTLLTGRWRFTWHGHGERGELFDRQNDPHELHNLWDSPEHATTRRELAGRLMDTLIANLDPLPLKTALC